MSLLADAETLELQANPAPRLRKPLLGRVTRGGVAGFLATLPMTLVMALRQGNLAFHDGSTLAPAEITKNMRLKSGLYTATRGLQVPVSVLGHFGYGAFLGSVFSLLPRERLGNPRASGALFGLAVWAVSYLGWLPALHLFPSAAQDDRPRQVSVILAHLVWGASLQLVLGRSFTERQTASSQKRGGRAWHRQGSGQ